MPAASIADRIKRLQRENSGPTVFHVRRPILLHDRNTSREPCPCCGSTRARVVDERSHIDLLIDVTDGTRRLRADVADKASFDIEAARATPLDMPLRCFALQLDIILDHATKVMGLFGGARGGKTSTLKEAAADRILLFGGRGREFWWVAPTREKTQIGVDMLVRGATADRWVPPVFPRELVVSYPEHEAAADQTIRLLDGTLVPLKYAGRRGGNLKGKPAAAAFVDEGCEIQHEINWSILMDRLTDFGGQCILATTPVGGHWLEAKVHDRGVKHTDIELAEKRPDVTSDTFSSLENPWIDPDEVWRRIRAEVGDEWENDPRIQREVFGKWIGEGDMLWRHFRERLDPLTGICHVRSFGRDVEDLSLVNVTASHVALAFHWVEGLQARQLGGHDFNLWPMSTVICQVAAPRGTDQTKPHNQILVAVDEVVKRGTIYDHAKFLAEGGAATHRRLPRDYFVGMPIVCDGTGAQASPPASHGVGLTSSATTLAQVLEQYGFVVRPPMWTSTGKAANPSKIDAVSLLHRLMASQTDPDERGFRWPRFIVSPERCPRLLHSLKTQTGDERGRPSKVSGNASDRLSGPTDALQYIAWALFSSEYSPRVEINW